jgi:hypothetical protein
MADYTVKIDLPDHKSGDRWPGIASIGPVVINGSQPASPLTRVRMHCVSFLGEKYKFDSDAGQSPDAPIIIVSAQNWTIRIPEVENFPADAGKYSWDMEFYQQGKTAPLTLYKGDITITCDTTR